jgi:hypothetical protein
MTTRTLLIEVDVDNPKGTLLTGSYAEVHLAVPGAELHLPASRQYSDIPLGGSTCRHRERRDQEILRDIVGAETKLFRLCTFDTEAQVRLIEGLLNS